MSNPMPTIDPYGAADWKDYDHNWRRRTPSGCSPEASFATPTLLSGTVPSHPVVSGLPQFGQFVYNQTEDALEFRSKDNVWKPYRSLPFNTKTVTDTTATVKIAHSRLLAATRESPSLRRHLHRSTVHRPRWRPHR